MQFIKRASGDGIVAAFVRVSALLACLLPAMAFAQKQQVNIFWFDDASCNAWSKSATNKALRMQYESWVRGFVSGHNYANPSRQVKIGKLPGSAQLNQFLDAYCKDHPTQSFVGGAIALVQELRETVPATKKAGAK
jgi:hypothetical protein